MEMSPTLNLSLSRHLFSGSCIAIKVMRISDAGSTVKNDSFKIQASNILLAGQSQDVFLLPHILSEGRGVVYFLYIYDHN